MKIKTLLLVLIVFIAGVGGCKKDKLNDIEIIDVLKEGEIVFSFNDLDLEDGLYFLSFEFNEEDAIVKKIIFSEDEFVTKEGDESGVFKLSTPSGECTYKVGIIDCAGQKEISWKDTIYVKELGQTDVVLNDNNALDD